MAIEKRWVLFAGIKAIHFEIDTSEEYPEVTMGNAKEDVPGAVIGIFDTPEDADMALERAISRGV